MKDYREILQEQLVLYQDLYRSIPEVLFNLQNVNNIRLRPEHLVTLERVISRDELFDAMMTLHNNKTPGCDGLTIEFYRKFWKSLVNPLYENYQMCVKIGELNPSGKRGIINLIPKKNKELSYVCNWRPITLLNNDYKIWAKALSNRLEIVSGYMIGNQQNGFIKGRNIFTNLRTTAEIVANCKKLNKAVVVVLVDFQKCFD